MDLGMARPQAGQVACMSSWLGLLSVLALVWSAPWNSVFHYRLKLAQPHLQAPPPANVIISGIGDLSVRVNPTLSRQLLINNACVCQAGMYVRDS